MCTFLYQNKVAKKLSACNLISANELNEMIMNYWNLAYKLLKFKIIWQTIIKISKDKLANP